MQGYLVNGECLGCKSEERPFIDKATGKASTFTDVKLGIRVATANGFDGETEVITVSMAKKHIDMNLPQLYNSLKGKEITVPVYIRPYPSKTGGGAGFQTNLSGDGKPLE